MVNAQHLRRLVQISLLATIAMVVLALGLVFAVPAGGTDQSVTAVTAISVALLTVSLLLAGLIFWLDQRLVATEERMASVFDHASVGIAQVSVKGVFIEVNEAFARLLGRPPEDLVGTHFAEYTHPDDVGKNLDDLRALVEGRIPSLAAEKRFLRADGQVVFARIASNLLRPDDGGEAFLMTFIEDVSETRVLRDEIQRSSEYDLLTGLANRGSFAAALDAALTANREFKSEGNLLVLDIDQFRIINDAGGHDAGDAYLRRFAQRLREILRTQDQLGRLDSDLFAILLQDCNEQAAVIVAEKLRSEIEALRVNWNGDRHQLTASIGSVHLPSGYEGDSTSALRDADAACISAKSRGRNRVVVHHEDDTQIRDRKDQVQHIQSLRDALENDKFELYAQSIEPIGDSATRARHVEVLLRLRGDDGEMIPTGEIVMAAEQFHLAAKLDQWVVRNTVQWLSDHERSLDRISMCAINLSGQSLSDERTLREISRVVRLGSVPPHKICFEITETAAVANLEAARHFIQRLKRVGCRFSLDDFGSGTSSFGYLKELPVDFIKIDGAFVRNLCADESNEAIVRSIVSLARDLGKRTIAEMVEEEAVMNRLVEFGVDYAQGYYVSRPKPIGEVLAA
jgi:diguanylate cyclase (GGDEF)-like protein/PAS domain S-box-containing protein